MFSFELENKKIGKIV